MAKQLGMINVRGTVGDISYVKTTDGYFVRRKSSITKERIATDSAFKNTRRNMKEFGLAGRSSKLLRDAFLITLKQAGDSKHFSRMLKTMMQALKADSTATKGNRRPEKGELGFFENFEFNRTNGMAGTFLVQYGAEIDRPGGKCVINLPDFNPQDTLLVPEDATHFKIISAAAELDFVNEKFELGKSESDYFETGSQSLQGFTLLNQVTPGSTLPIMMVLGIRFYQFVNNVYYQLDADDFNALRIVKVSAS